MSESEEHMTLITQASYGNDVAIDALLERHLPGLRGYLRLKAGDLILAKESVSDLAQSVCREILQNLPVFEYKGEAAFRHWLYTKATNKIIDRARYYSAKKRDAALDVSTPGGSSSEAPGLDDLFVTLTTPSQVAVGHEELEQLQQTFRELPEDYREVIIQAKIIGLSAAEIAANMNRTESAIHALLHRALARLARLMSHEEGAEKKKPSGLDGSIPGPPEPDG